MRAEQPKSKVTDLAFDATIRAAAPYQRLREDNGCALNIKEEDLRQKVREKRIGNTFLFAVDASGPWVHVSVCAPLRVPFSTCCRRRTKA